MACPTGKMISIRITPPTPPPMMVPSLLKTEAMAPVVNPRAIRREYDIRSLT